MRLLKPFFRILPHAAGTAVLVASLGSGPLALHAQDSDQSERDRSFIVGFLEDNLSGAGRDIRIEGFAGLLSSRATLEELTISDAEGVWFTMRDAVLDWDRSALLGKRLEINQITAAEIVVERLPVTDDTLDLPDPEVTPFSLPDLPVAIDIGRIAVERASLGASVLRVGEAVDIALEGSAQIKNGEGSASLDIARLDDEGQFLVDVAYSNDTEVLDLDVSLEEGPNGIISGLANLPGAPPLRLSIAGAGPLDDFTADIALATNGEDRLSGQAQLSTPPAEENTETNAAEIAPQPRLFSVDLSGDLTPLFAGTMRVSSARRAGWWPKARHTPMVVSILMTSRLKHRRFRFRARWQSRLTACRNPLPCRGASHR